MAMNVNRVILAGRLTRDVELRHNDAGQARASFSVAVNRSYRTASGEPKETVLFMDCDTFGKAAEAMAKYVRKGSTILLEGRLENRSWEDKDGQTKHRTIVVAEHVNFGPEQTSDKPEKRPATASKAPASQMNAGDDEHPPF